MSELQPRPRSRAIIFFVAAAIFAGYAIVCGELAITVLFGVASALNLAMTIRIVRS